MQCDAVNYAYAICMKSVAEKIVQHYIMGSRTRCLNGFTFSSLVEVIVFISRLLIYL